MTWDHTIAMNIPTLLTMLLKRVVVWGHTPQPTGGGQETTFRGWFSLTSMGPGVELSH